MKKNFIASIVAAVAIDLELDTPGVYNTSLVLI